MFDEVDLSWGTVKLSSKRPPIVRVGEQTSKPVKALTRLTARNSP